jgi:hypothetical protein
MKYSLDLITNNEVLVEFTRANANLLNKHKISSTEELVMLWRKEYDIGLRLPDKLIFNSEKDLTLFLLRWS